MFRFNGSLRSLTLMLHNSPMQQNLLLWHKGFSLWCHKGFFFGATCIDSCTTTIFPFHVVTSKKLCLSRVVNSLLITITSCKIVHAPRCAPHASVASVHTLLTYKQMLLVFSIYTIALPTVHILLFTIQSYTCIYNNTYIYHKSAQHT